MGIHRATYGTVTDPDAAAASDYGTRRRSAAAFPHTTNLPSPVIAEESPAVHRARTQQLFAKREHTQRGDP